MMWTSETSRQRQANSRTTHAISIAQHTNTNNNNNSNNSSNSNNSNNNNRNSKNSSNSNIQLFSRSAISWPCQRLHIVRRDLNQSLRLVRYARGTTTATTAASTTTSKQRQQQQQEQETTMTTTATTTTIIKGVKAAVDKSHNTPNDGCESIMSLFRNERSS
jgi:hypothetical protein